MIRARFRVGSEDYRPVNWPVQHPYWCTGHCLLPSGEWSPVVVAYADDEAEIRANWPDAEDIESKPCEGYTFTPRFPRPDWLHGKALEILDD